MNLLEVRNLAKHYVLRRGMLRRELGIIRAVDGVSFDIRRGETLSLVGESGCGKTTVSRCILRAIQPNSGSMKFTFGEGRTVDLATIKRRSLRAVRQHLQMIFQDPHSSLNPRMTIGDIVAEPLLVNGIGPSAARRERVLELLDLVQLPRAAYLRFPHAFSGGQRQRVGIARALALHPDLIVADEPVSALDVSVQAQIVNLLLDLQERLGLSYLFIGHDLSVVKHVSDRVAVMYVGRIVEIAPTRELFESPKHPYTEALLSAVPKPDPKASANRIVLKGEVADAADPPSGCHFHPRCPYATEHCRLEVPPLRELSTGHSVACHYAAELMLRGIPTARGL